MPSTSRLDCDPTLKRGKQRGELITLQKPEEIDPQMQTQRMIERWHHTLMNRNLLENSCLSGDLEQEVTDFVSRYNHLRYHENIADLTPADVYLG